MDKNGKVIFQSMCASTLVVHEPAFSVHVEFPGRGSVQAIPMETVRQLLWRQGFKNMITSGLLYINDMEDKIELGLEDPDTKVPTKIKVFTPEQILTLLKVKSYDEFVKEVESAPIEQANAIVDYAVEHSILDAQKIEFLKKVTNRDVIQLLNRKRMNEEAERLAAEKESRRKAEGEFNAI